MDVDQTTALNALQVLTQPVARQENEHDGNMLDKMLESNMNELQRKLDACDQSKELIDWKMMHSISNIRWRFVVLNLKFLNYLSLTTKNVIVMLNEQKETVALKVEVKSRLNVSAENDAPPLSVDILSAPQQKVVMSSLQFIVCLGIYPCLINGVGMPLEKRSEFVKIVLSEPGRDEMSRIEKDSRLVTITNILLECIECSSLATLVLSKHLSDILCALAQVCLAPRKILNSTIADSTVEVASTDTTNFKMTSDIRSSNLQSVINDSDIVSCKQKLSDLIDRVYPPVLVREVLLLQGVCSLDASAKRPPKWLRNFYQQVFFQTITKPNGLNMVLKGLMDEDNKSTNWQRYDATAKLIVGCPPYNCTTEQYYSKLAPQILDLFANADRSSHAHFIRMAVSIVSAMTSHQPQLTRDIVVQPLISPLASCLKKLDELTEPESSGYLKVFVTELCLTRCIENVHKLFVSGSEPHLHLVEHLKPVTHVLFSLYCFTRHCITYLKNPVEEILLCLLRHLDSAIAASCLQELSLGGNIEFQRMDDKLKFSLGEGGGVLIVIDSTTDGPEWQTLAENIVNLIVIVKQDNLSATFFIRCLQELTKIVSHEHDEDEPADDNSLLEIDYKLTKLKVHLQRNLTLLNLLSLMCNQLGHSCLRNSVHILQFAQTTLERGVKLLSRTKDDVIFVEFESETLTMTMGLLTALLADKSSDFDWKQTQGLLPLLQTLTDLHPNSEIQEMAQDLHIALVTHGFVHLDKNDRAPPSSEKHSASFKKSTDSTLSYKQSSNLSNKHRHPLVQVLSSNDNTDTDPGTVLHHAHNVHQQDVIERKNMTSDLSILAKSKSLNTEATNKDSLVQVFNEICDPLVPVRGHALILLSKLIKSNDTETLKERDKVLKLCIENLGHLDSYIYLPAIQALAALADHFPQEVLPVLAKEYAGQTNEKRCIERRVKIGEVLVKVSSALGPLIPHYRDVLIASILSAAKNDEPLVRASALSNLGEICRLLHFALGSVMHEVFECIHSILLYDCNVEVQRSAAMCITFLLRGCSKESLKTLSGLLSKLYKLLKQTMKSNKDELVQMHVQMALGELDALMKDFLFPKQTLSVNIRVLDPPEF